MLINMLNLITFVWLTFWACIAILKIANSTSRSIYFIMIIFYIFFGIPLFLDVILGQPSYFSYPGINLANNYSIVQIVYDLYVSFIPFTWWIIERKYSSRAHFFDNSKNYIFVRRLKPFLFIALFSLPIALYLAPEPKLYLEYGAAPLKLLKAYGHDAAEYHNLVMVPTIVLSIIAV